jgi:hypothetical protein
MPEKNTVMSSERQGAIAGVLSLYEGHNKSFVTVTLFQFVMGILCRICMLCCTSCTHIAISFVDELLRQHGFKPISEYGTFIAFL